jgi:hypothetical protein
MEDQKQILTLQDAAIKGLDVKKAANEARELLLCQLPLNAYKYLEEVCFYSHELSEAIITKEASEIRSLLKIQNEDEQYAVECINNAVWDHKKRKVTIDVGRPVNLRVFSDRIAYNYEITIVINGKK